VFLATAAYQGIAEATDAPIHLGITEAGGLTTGTVKSPLALAICCGRGSATQSASACPPIRWKR